MRYTAGTLLIKEANASITLCEIAADDLPDFKETGTHIAFFDLDRLMFPLVVRNLRPGDRFSPLGVNGTQKVKKYLINLTTIVNLMITTQETIKNVNHLHFQMI